MLNAVKVPGKMIPRHLRSNYTGRKFRVEVREAVTIPADAGVWGGGSRDTYKAVRLADGAEITLGSTAAPWDPSRKDRTIVMSPDIAVVMHTFFQGVDMGLTFYIHPANAVKFLPQS